MDDNPLLQNATFEEITAELSRRDGSFVWIQLQKPENKTCETCGQWLGESERTKMLGSAFSAFAKWNETLRGKNPCQP